VQEKNAFSQPDIATRAVFHLGDCLEILDGLTANSVDLIYLDPPYFLSREFSLEGGNSDVSFKRGWEDSEILTEYESLGHLLGQEDLGRYMSFMHRRLSAMREVLKESGSIFLHIGTEEGPYLRIVLDSVFGHKNLRSTITWQRSHPHNNLKRSIGGVSDFIYYYTKSNKYKFNVLHLPHDEKYLTNSFNNEDDIGRYALAPIIQERARVGFFYEFEGLVPPNGWRVKEETLQRLSKEGRIHWGTNRPYKKIYLHEAQGPALQNIWTDVYNITRTDIDKRRYPTQKPIALLRRIIEVATDPGDLVLDPFSGSGTTVAAALSLGRRGVGIDASKEAIAISQNRILEQDEGKLF
jgi:DNA modification methylase